MAHFLMAEAQSEPVLIICQSRLAVQVEIEVNNFLCQFLFLLCLSLFCSVVPTIYFSNMESLPELGLIISICQAARLESYLYLSFVFACDFIRPMVTQCVLPKDKRNQSSLSERSDSHFHL